MVETDSRDVSVPKVRWTLRSVLDLEIIVCINQFNTKGTKKLYEYNMILSRRNSADTFVNNYQRVRIVANIDIGALKKQK